MPRKVTLLQLTALLALAASALASGALFAGDAKNPAKEAPAKPPPAKQSPPPAAAGPDAAALDARVSAFLDGHREQWHDLNVPYEDGKALFDLIVRKRFTRALEIGTSTGHSAIWIAWALSKTHGKLITIEIDPGRQRTAQQNFEAAGLSGYIDARLTDAHRLVKELPGPYDFVFSDADKDWYTQYFRDLEGKLTVGGCFTAHNVLDGFSGIAEFLAYARSRPNYSTEILHTSRSGISVSCRVR
jgi:caffeoyl-CoA O-methyltransferase